MCECADTFLLPVLSPEREQPCPSFLHLSQTFWAFLQVWQVWRVLVLLNHSQNACFAHRESGGLAWARKSLVRWCSRL